MAVVSKALQEYVEVQQIRLAMKDLQEEAEKLKVEKLELHKEILWLEDLLDKYV